MKNKISLDELKNTVLENGESVLVYFHADGGQACVPGIRNFSDPIKAVNFSSRELNDLDHYCKNSVRIFIIKDEPLEKDKGMSHKEFDFQHRTEN